MPLVVWALPDYWQFMQVLHSACRYAAMVKIRRKGSSGNTLTVVLFFLSVSF